MTRKLFLIGNFSKYDIGGVRAELVSNDINVMTFRDIFLISLSWLTLCI